MTLTINERIFLHGECQIFALVLHAELGLPIVHFFCGPRSRRNFCHSAVKVRRGVYLDVRGRQTTEQLRRYWSHRQLGWRSMQISDRSARRLMAAWARRRNFVRKLTLAHRIFRRNRSRYSNV